MSEDGERVSIASYFKHEKKLLALTTVTGIVYNVGMTAGPWFEGQLAQYLFDIANGVRQAPDIVFLSLAYVAVIALVQGMRALKRLYVRKFANNVSRSMKQGIFRHLVRETYDEAQREDAGALMTRAVADADACAEGMRKFTTEIFDTGVVMVAYLVMLFALDWRLACIVLIFPPIAYIAAAVLKKRVSTSTGASRRAMSSLNDAAVDAASHALTYRIYGEGANRAAAYERVLSEYERSNVAAGVWQNSPQPIYLAISMVGVIAILYFGGANVLGGGWSAWDIATFSTFLSCFTKLATKSSHAAKLFNAVQQAQVSWDRIKGYLGERTDAEAPCKAAEPARLEMERAGCVYENDGGGRPFELHDLNLVADPGQIVGVTGKVASGKSAFGRLFLCEFPHEGQIRFGGREISAVNSQVFAYAGHDPELFTGTVRENVAFAEAGSADEGRLARVLAEVQIDGEVGPDTPVGAEGGELSGGQRARIALARALYSKAPVLVLDDPFAAVDAETEGRIFEALRADEGWRTIFIISHRMELFPQMDRVVFLENGTMASGTHGQMMGNGGYRALFELQGAHGSAGKGQTDGKSAANRVAESKSTASARNAAAADAAPQTGKTDVKRIVLRSLSAHKLRTLVAAVMVVASIVLEIAPPLVLAQAVDELTGNSAVSLALAAGYFALIAGSGLASAVREALIVAVGEGVTHALRTAMMAKLRRLPATYFTRHEAGKTASVQVNDVDAIEDLFSSGIVSMFTDLGCVVGMMAVIFTKSLGLGLLLLVALPLLFAFTVRVQRKSLAANLQNRRATAHASGILPETMHVIRSLHVYRAERFAQARYDAAVQDSFRAVERTNLYDAVYSPVILTVSAAVIGVMMSLSGQGGALQALFGMSVGTAVALISYVNSIFTPLASIGMEIQTVQSATAGWKRVQAFLNEAERTDPGAVDAGKQRHARTADEGNRAVQPRNAIEVRDVSFSYDDASPVLERFSLTVREGEFVTLTGRTGAGKSTLFKLVLGLYAPDAGIVRVDGRDPRGLEGADRRATLCCVEQKPAIVPGCVRDQVTLGNGAFPDEAVWKALETAGLRATVAALPQGLDAPYRDSLFSQGQKQLLTIARAIVSDPKILLLDEVTAGLDSATEKTVTEALRKASADRTVLSISHRMQEAVAGRIVDITG